MMSVPFFLHFEQINIKKKKKKWELLCAGSTLEHLSRRNIRVTFQRHKTRERKTPPPAPRNSSARHLRGFGRMSQRSSWKGGLVPAQTARVFQAKFHSFHSRRLPTAASRTEEFGLRPCRRSQPSQSSESWVALKPWRNGKSTAPPTKKDSKETAAAPGAQVILPMGGFCPGYQA